MTNQLVLSHQGRADILVVDDSPEVLHMLGSVLSPHYQVRVANCGERALALASAAPPDLMLLDVVMPDMDGYQLLTRLRASPGTSEVPVIFLSAMDGTGDEEQGLRLGAADYMTKPVRGPIVLARVAAQLELRRAREWLRGQNEFLEAEVRRRMAENQMVQDASIYALAQLAEIRDPETGAHILRTQNYVHVLARLLQQHPGFAATLDDRTVELIYKSAPLHDIGKVGIPDSVLRKPGTLTAEEWRIMRSHCRLGADAIAAAQGKLAGKLDFLEMARVIALTHHEKWDGSGYPQGLAGNDIPLAGRLMAVADVFDALITARVYKPALPMDEARAIIEAGRGIHFDPDITAVFLAHFDQFVAIAERHRLPPPDA